MERSRRAREVGALHPIATVAHTVHDRGVPFQVRVISTLVEKRAAGCAHWPTADAAASPNPFLPYEPDLFVTDVCDTHVCLLNKYNVIDHHVLVVTRAFELQESALTRADFAALWTCMNEYDALGFYNSGPVAGASQPHKHMQLVPLPLAAEGPAIPLQAVLESDPPGRAATEIRELPFRHAFSWLNGIDGEPRTEQAGRLHRLYLRMLAATAPTLLERQPYNLLLTRRYMLLIPRRFERFETLGVNALGFAGSFFVADPADSDLIQRIGPMRILRHVAFPPSKAIAP